jgi:small subunit ribosomal protein S20
MANNPSAKKRIRQNHKRRLANRYKLVKSRNLIQKFLRTSTKAEAQALYPEVISAIDILAKTNIIHRNKAARQKSRLTLRLNAMA